VCLSAYFTTNATQFYILAVIVGLVMGGIQSLSRSTYSKLIPQDITDSASFFSFYDVTEKIAIVGGMFSFGLVDDITNSMRNSALVLCIYFIAGLILLLSLLSYQRKVRTAMPVEVVVQD
jgi:UMF1 family MFS transporter